jgi:phenylpropionate dioxygenase-like ring-hydroxylating dioxygenase large terminal subunit
VSAWHALVPSHDVPVGGIVPAVFGDEDLAVWRDVDGVAHVSEARCPHNWSHLAGVGEVQGCELVCTTHFWRFSAEGVGVRRLSDGTEEPMRDLRVFPVREHDGWIETTEPAVTCSGTTD